MEVQSPVTRIVADLGNSRLKWGRVDPDGRLGATVAMPTDDPSAWASAWDDWGLSEGRSVWAISSVNPPAADRFGRFLEAKDVAEVHWRRSVAEVPVRHDLEETETGGADRALAVMAALARHQGRGPGLVVLCGTAIVVERISAEGVWQGGAIAPGMGPMAKALHLLTAQLPEVRPREAPLPFGRSTVPSLEAGIFWGLVGAIRELLTRQAEGLAPIPWLVWTGGDAPTFARWVEWPGSPEQGRFPHRVGLALPRAGSRQGKPYPTEMPESVGVPDWPSAEVVPHLVLEGLTRMAWDDLAGSVEGAT